MSYSSNILLIYSIEKYVGHLCIFRLDLFYYFPEISPRVSKVIHKYPQNNSVEL